MATTQEYIEQLKIDKQNLVENLVAKGVTATSDETFTSLVPKVNDIQSGGDLSEYFSGTITKGTSSIGGWTNSVMKIPALTITGTSCAYMYYGFKGTKIDLSKLDTSNVTTMEGMFYSCQYLTSLDLSKLNTSKVTKMNYMFSAISIGASTPITTIDVSNFNTEKVTTMSSMFSSSKTLKSIVGLNNFNTSSVTNMNSVFSSCENITSLDLSKWNTNQVTDMGNMFRGNFNLTSLDVSGFNTSQVTNVSYMFAYLRKLTTLNIGNFDFSKITSISGIFRDCPELTNLTFAYNLGLGFLPTASANYSSYTLDVSTSTKLSETSLISILNGLADIKSLGVQSQKCVLGPTNLAKLTSEAGQQALAQAEAYGWTVN